jgi:hypothetical protein
LNAPAVGLRAIDQGAGRTIMRVHSEWARRPDDEKFLSLPDLFASVNARAVTSEAHAVDVTSLRVKAIDADRNLYLHDDNGEMKFENWSFGQTCQLLGVPAGYLRNLPPKIAGINLQYALSNFREELVKTYRQADGSNAPSILRAVTGPQYGRITDAQVVQAVMGIAGNGTGDTAWKVPGVIQAGGYNPHVDVSKETTTLYASDRDVFMFLVDDTHPIEIGKLRDGSPDLIFRGFYVWNSEVGSKSLGIATMYLRGVCCNRILWGVEGFQELTMRHSSQAPARFVAESEPALADFANANTGKLLSGIREARGAIVARNDEERREFLQRQKFSKAASDAIIKAVTDEEGAPPESIWDFVQGITAAARKAPHQDARIDLERAGQRLLEKVAA